MITLLPDGTSEKSTTTSYRLPGSNTSVSVCAGVPK